MPHNKKTILQLFGAYVQLCRLNFLPSCRGVIAMQERLTQCTKILEYIKTHGSITPNDADRAFHCKRLASRITDLKKRGYIIESKLETGINADGRRVRYARYSILGKESEADSCG